MTLPSMKKCGLNTTEIRQMERYFKKHEASLSDVNAPYWAFYNDIIHPSLYDINGGTYIGVQNRHDARGRNHYVAQNLASAPKACPTSPYFTNELKIDVNTVVMPNRKHLWTRPMDRASFGKYQIFTYEFDEDLIFFGTQLSWMRSSDGKPANSVMGHLYRELSYWIDFDRIVVVYSGNKSFHIHIVFKTAFASQNGISDNFREGHIAHWHTLAPIVTRVLKVTAQLDESLARPEQLRRMPGGMRILDKANILGFPAGTHVPQVMVWQMCRNKRATGAEKSFFDPTLYIPSARVVNKRKNQQGSAVLSNQIIPSSSQISTAHVAAGIDQAELDFYENKLAQEFPDSAYPCFSHLKIHANGSASAYFHNHEHDRQPSSVMGDSYATILIQGKDPNGLKTGDASLPLPLGEMLDLWGEEYHATSDVTETAVEQAFANMARCGATAQKALRKLIRDIIQINNVKHKRHIINAPEGVSKTTSFFNEHAFIDQWLRQNGQGHIMYAFADRRAASKKCEEFNLRNASGNYLGVYLPSFQHVYEDIVKQLGLVEITNDALLDGKHSNRWEAIEELQPAVTDELKARHAALWAQIGTKTPVMFTVHAVAHRWHQGNMSRLMWAKSFWRLYGDVAQRSVCRNETALNLLVHDELKPADLVAAYPKHKVEIVKSLIGTVPWINANSTLVKYDTFHRYMKRIKSDGISFEDVLELDDLLSRNHDVVTTKDSGEYEIRDFPYYSDCFGQEWYISPHIWPIDSADRVVCLTTERVPTAVAEKTEYWDILRLRTPHIPRDCVTVIRDRRVISKNLLKICSEKRYEIARCKLTPMYIISNRVSGLKRSFTHEGAKGSNQFIGSDILQAMCFKPAEEFEQLEALNAWTRSTTLVRERHIDEFNQTAGRNLGFRKHGDAAHYLLMSDSLWLRLQGPVLQHCRYAMTLVCNDNVRRKAAKTF